MIEKKHLNAVVFDLDDTLLHDDRTISGFSISVFRNLHQAGFTFIAASGRAQLSMKPYIDQLSCVSAYIACNGAEIWDAQTHRLLRCDMIPASTAKEIALFAEENDCYAHVYDGDSFFFNRYSEHSVRYSASSKLKGVYAGKLSRFIKEDRNKIILIDDQEKIASLYRTASKRFAGKASVTCSKPIYLEFNPLNSSKGNALRYVSSILGLQCDGFIAFGDSLNDLSMLQEAGHAVTVSNGWKEIRPFCDAVCGSNNDDGPARYLYQHFLSEEVAK